MQFQQNRLFFLNTFAGDYLLTKQKSNNIIKQVKPKEKILW